MRKIKNHLLCSCSGDDISEKKDQSIIRRILKRGESWAKPSDGSKVDVTIKGIYEDRVFDERTVKFIVGEGFLQNIPDGFVVSPMVFSIDQYLSTFF